jgi:hypothetical protein
VRDLSEINMADDFSRPRWPNQIHLSPKSHHHSVGWPEEQQFLHKEDE